MTPLVRLSVLLLACVAACVPRGEAPRPVGRAEQAAPSPRVTMAQGLGAALFFGRGGCTACHRLGADGHADVGPNLGVGPGFDAPLARRERTGGDPFGYALRSVVDPDAFVVPTFPPGKMPRVEEPPVALEDRALIALAAFLAGREADPEAPPLADERFDGAVAEIAEMRRDRSRRVSERHMAELRAHVAWDHVQAAEGPRVYVARGCAGCHGPPERRSFRAPTASGATDPQAQREAALAWLARTLPRRASCAELVRPSELGDLAAWLAAP